jgi:hypothetical protein
MFNNTNDFFDLVREGNVSQIDIQEFVYKKTKKHKTDKLTTLLKDIEFYLFTEKENLIAEITPEMWEEKHNYYKAKGENIPYKEIENIMIKLKKNKGIDTKDEPKYYRYYDEIELFFPTEFFCIYQLKNYITKLIQNTNAKQDNLFLKSNSFNNFNQYIKLHIIEPYVDYSYLFQRMLNEKIIDKIRHIDFIEWLFINEYITEKTKDEFIKKEGFRSLKKSYSLSRENNFNNVFNK